MTALTADREIRTNVGQKISGDVTNLEIVYKSGYGSINTSTGYFESYTAAASQLPLGGYYDGKVTGATGDSPVPEAACGIDGGVVERQVVTGASAITDNGKFVYLSDDNLYTLTKPTFGSPIGLIVRWRTSTSCDILMFPLSVLANQSHKTSRMIAEIDVGSASSFATANMRTSIPLTDRKKIVGFFGMTSVPIVSGASAAIETPSFTFNLEINGTNVSGGALGGFITYSAASALGTYNASSAISVANTYDEGDLLDIKAVVTTGPATGKVELWLVEENLPGN